MGISTEEQPDIASAGHDPLGTNEPTTNAKPRISLDFHRFTELPERYDSDVSEGIEKRLVASPVNLQDEDDVDSDPGSPETPAPTHYDEENDPPIAIDKENNIQSTDNEASDKIQSISPSRLPSVSSSFEMIEHASSSLSAPGESFPSAPLTFAEDATQWTASRGFGPSFPSMASEPKGKERAQPSGYAEKILEARAQQDKKWRRNLREEREREQQQAIASQTGRRFSLFDKANDREEEYSQESGSDIWERDSIGDHDKQSDDAEDLEDEATRLLLGELETQDREEHDFNDDAFSAIHARFKFEPGIDMHQAIHRLIDHLTAIRPYENWRTLRALDLSEQNIISIRDLASLVPALETLNVSNNAISEMTNLPISLQVLKAKSNRLTSTAPFQHLQNLHYLDICNNAINSFEGIAPLYHLRTLHAEYNKITSCGPLKHMKGLIHLNLRSNAIKHLHFRKTKMVSLETLDLAYNRIECFEAIEGLTNLRVLNIEHNDIKWMQIIAPMEKLKVLRISYNRLKAFDATFFPDLRTLYLDDNQIVRIIGLSLMPRIGSFSLRDQGGQNVDVNLRYLRGTRKMYLSGNAMKQLNRMEDFFTLEYLELCSIQLEELPKDFSKHVPNLGALYLGHNYLKDITPLRKLRHLQKLVLIDNQLVSLEKTIDTIKTMNRLHYLDLRQNMMTSKLYPAIKTIEQSKLSNNVSCYLVNEHDTTWITRDTQFYQSMPDHWRERRQSYRALFIKCRPMLKTLDNLPITEEETNSADAIASKLKLKQLSQ
ncbi:hypothetical protein BJV82DRAFT_592452 [Fennellomyces sp. T-0311]|nr:hypothetical protein BJV82DRAFT_592452 [Fennellomyces sp. T-0311]